MTHIFIYEEGEGAGSAEEGPPLVDLTSLEVHGSTAPGDCHDCLYLNIMFSKSRRDEMNFCSST